jgi:hypothetical protein
METQPAISNIPITQAEADASRVTLIEAARVTAKSGKKYWDKLSEDIERLMAPLAIEDRLNYRVWETCYHTLVGMNKEKFDAEDRAAVETASREAAARSSAPIENQTPPPPLDAKIVSKVLPGLGISEEQYRAATEHIAKGVWPLTAENIGGRKINIGGK